MDTTSKKSPLKDDSRVRLALATLTGEEKSVLERFATYQENTGFGFPKSDTVNFLEVAWFGWTASASS